MITLNTIWIILVLSTVLICAGLFFKKKALILVFFGGLIIMLTGITTFTDEISIPTLNETYVYDNGTLTNVVEVLQPTPINSAINIILSWSMMLLGLACIIGSTIKLYDSKFDEEEDQILKH